MLHDLILGVLRGISFAVVDRDLANLLLCSVRTKQRYIDEQWPVRSSLELQNTGTRATALG